MSLEQITKEQLNILLENSPLGIVLTDTHLNFMYTNPSFQKMLGYTCKELSSMKVMDVTSPESKNISHSAIQKSFKSGQPTTIEKRYIRKDGQIIHAITRISSVFDDSGTPIYQCTNIEDVTEKLKTKDKLEQSHLEIRQLIATAHEGIIQYDQHRKLLICNVEAQRILGWSEVDINYMTIDDVIYMIRKSDSNDDIHFFNMNHDKKRQAVISCKNRLGKTLWLEVTIISSMYMESRRNTLFLRDITENKATEEQLRYLATYDVLTELPNRTLFLELLNNAINSSARTQSKHAILFIDIDRFKDINDSLGHMIGDELLKQVASRFKQVARKEDIVARLGGDEFIILIHNIKDIFDCSIVAEKIIKKINQPFEMGEIEEVFINVSIGIAIYPDHGLTALELLKNVDAAQYMAKKEAKSNYQVFDSHIRNQILTRISLLDGLRKAIKNNEIIIHYQNKVNLSDHSYSGCEALVRWKHPVQGMIPPNQFIPIAESSGLIYTLGDHILKTVCHQTYPLYIKKKLNYRIAINISCVQFRQKDLFNKIEALLETSNFNPEWIELEITEGAIMEDVDNAIILMKKLRDKGIHLSIDDFGTGYSSLSYLKSLPVNNLKIDKTFIDDILTSHEDKSMVASIINLSHNLNLSVIAEGVETREQANVLLDMGCDIAQGYFFSRPVCLSQFKKANLNGMYGQ